MKVGKTFSSTVAPGSYSKTVYDSTQKSWKIDGPTGTGLKVNEFFILHLGVCKRVYATPRLAAALSVPTTNSLNQPKKKMMKKKKNGLRSRLYS